MRRRAFSFSSSRKRFSAGRSVEANDFSKPNLASSTLLRNVSQHRPSLVATELRVCRWPIIRLIADF